MCSVLSEQPSVCIKVQLKKKNAEDDFIQCSKVQGFNTSTQNPTPDFQSSTQNVTFDYNFPFFFPPVAQRHSKIVIGP